MKTVFLDRDGVISRFTPNDYVKKWEEFEFVPGAIEALTRLSRAGYRLVIISNQGGVHKGIFTEESLSGVTRRMEAVLEKHGVGLDRVYYCLHTAEENCDCRKPKPGLFHRAAGELGSLDLGAAYFVGDSNIDVQAGRNAGTKTILVLSGNTRTAEETDGWPVKPDFIARDLNEAADIIMKDVRSET